MRQCRVIEASVPSDCPYDIDYPATLRCGKYSVVIGKGVESLNNDLLTMIIAYVDFVDGRARYL